MLRHEILTNFIHFQDVEQLDFHQGCNFFIGQNSSGKTSVFEAARRCLSLQQSTSVSSAHDDSKLSAVTCVFLIDNEQKQKGKLFSSVIRFPSRDEYRAIYVKVSFETIERSFGVDLVKETNKRILVNRQVRIPDESNLKEQIEAFIQFEHSPIKENLTPIFEEIEGIISSQVNDFQRETEQKLVLDTECEHILRKHVDDSTVFTFSVRGIGPCQWSKSRRVTNDYKVKNYKSAQKRAEIIQWYLKEQKENRIDESDHNNVLRLFNTITNHNGLRFRLTDNDGLEAFTRKRDLDSDQYQSLAMLKVPEGILEAMNSAIILGTKTFKTIFLEEPEKGMHPQMIERMRDLVLKNIDNKMVFITSHHQSFLGPWTVPKLFIFKRSENDRGVAFQVCPGFDLGLEDIDSKTPRIITSQHFASIFFAKRVLFVEGEGDYLFMTTLKLLLLADDEVVEGLICNGTQEIEQFRIFLCSLHIATLNGETQKFRFNRLCYKLDIKAYFILDKDAILDHKKSVQTFLDNFDLRDFDEKKVNQDPALLESKGIFVWKGTIEDALIEHSKFHQNIKAFFKENHVELKYNEETKKNKRYKLFCKKEVTDVNISEVVSRVSKDCIEDRKKERKTEICRMLAFLANSSKEQECQNVT